MLNLLANIVLISALACGKEALPVTPLDVQVGRHAVELRKSLEVRAPGARLILFVRKTDGLGITDPDVAGCIQNDRTGGIGKRLLDGPGWQATQAGAYGIFFLSRLQGLGTDRGRSNRTSRAVNV